MALAYEGHHKKHTRRQSVIMFVGLGQRETRDKFQKPKSKWMQEHNLENYEEIEVLQTVPGGGSGEQKIHQVGCYLQPQQFQSYSTSFLFALPKTKHIRSSMVPRSLKYTPLELDRMEQAVAASYPGTRVPCEICNRMVIRQKLRLHINECHFVEGKSIACHICGVLLRSTGSFRVHLWRHRHQKLRGLLHPTKQRTYVSI